MRETPGGSTNESFVQAHDTVVQIARGMFGEGPMSPAQVIPLHDEVHRDFLVIQRLEYDGKEVVHRTGAGGGPTRTFEHVLCITPKTTREMLQQPAIATTQYQGDPDDVVYVNPGRGRNNDADDSGGF